MSTNSTETGALLSRGLQPLGKAHISILSQKCWQPTSLEVVLNTGHSSQWESLYHLKIAIMDVCVWFSVLSSRASNRL